MNLQCLEGFSPLWDNVLLKKKKKWNTAMWLVKGGQLIYNNNPFLFLKSIHWIHLVHLEFISQDIEQTFSWKASSLFHFHMFLIVQFLWEKAINWTKLQFGCEFFSMDLCPKGDKLDAKLSLIVTWEINTKLFWKQKERFVSQSVTVRFRHHKFLQYLLFFEVNDDK